MTVSADLVNESLQLIGFDGPPVTGTAPNFDTSTAGQSAALIYAPSIAAVARMNNWDFARTTVALVLTGNPAPFPWSFEYAFPANCVQIWQIIPPSLADPLNPVPTNWVRGAIQNSISVIWANLANAVAVFNGNPIETTWDPIFRSTVVRYLAAEFAIGLLGKPDLAQSLFEEVGTMVQLGAARVDV
jgi:hypothetical protein